MADLGTINYTNVNAGTQRVDSSAELRGIGQTLQAGKQIIDEGVKAKVTGDMLDIIAEAEANSTTVEPERPVYEAGSPGEYYAARIDRLNTIIEQGRTSQKTLAENQIKSLLASAQAKYPWLYQELQARAGAVVAGSAQLAEIGLEDSIRSAQARAAQSEFDALLDHAHKNLNIDPAISPLDPKFTEEYVEAQTRWDTTMRSAAVAGAQIAQGVDTYLNNPKMYNELQKMVGDAEGAIQTRWWALNREFRFDKLRVELSKGEQGNQVFIQQWIDGGTGGLMLEQMLQDRADTMKLFEQLVPSEIRQDPRGAALYALRKDAEKQWDDYIETMKDTLNKIPGAADRLDMMMSMRGLNTFGNLSEPHKNIISFLSTEYGKNAAELAAKAANPEGLLLQDTMALASQSLVSGAFPELMKGTGGNATTSPTGATVAQVANSNSAYEIPPNANFQGVLDAINFRIADSKNTWLVPVNGVEEELIAALRTRDLNIGLWEAAKGVVSKGNPEFANKTLLGVTYSMEYQNKVQGMPKNVEENQLNFLANGSLMQAVDRSLEGGPSAVRNAFGHSAQQFYVKSDPMGAKQDATNKFHNEHLGAGLSLNDVVKLDMDKIENGTFSYTIDAEAIKPLAAHLGARSPGMFTQSQPQEARDLVNEKMAEIMRVMERQIATERLINKAKSLDGKVFQQPDTWQDFFFGNGSPDPGSAWANVFIGN